MSEGPHAATLLSIRPSRGPRFSNSAPVVAFRKASPIARVHAAAPPFLVLHGSGDTIIPVAQARDFVARLRDVSRAPVGYLELPGAGHGFDMTDGARTGSAATAIGLFLNQIHRARLVSQAKQAI